MKSKCLHRTTARFCATAAALALAAPTTQRVNADTLTLIATQDNTLYESSGGTLSNGAGDYIFTGRTGQSPGLSIRRALVQFDLSLIPTDATINSAALSLRLSRSNVAGSETVAIHRVLNSWGEGTSNASGQEGEGAPAAPGDATWRHRFYNTTFWNTPGGDFVPANSAAASVGTQNAFYSWSSPQMTLDVQGWLANPAANAGWIVIGNESAIETAKRFDSRNIGDASRRPRLVIDFTAMASWANDADGNWSAGANWTTGTAPNGIGAQARLGPVITVPRQVMLDVPVTLGTLKLECDSYYTITGSQTLTFDVSSGSAMIQVISGSQRISAPVHFAKTATVDLAATSGLTLSSPMTAASGVTLTKTGAGQFSVASLRSDGVVLQEGTTRILPNGTAAATSRVKLLEIAGGAAPTARLDLNDNALVIDYDGASPINTVHQQIKSAHAGGDWSGNGIGSSMANASQFGVGYAEASALSTVPAIFGATDSTTLLLHLTRYGDSNLDGLVNLADFNSLAANFGGSSGVWSQGDFNYDGLVNLADFNLLAANFGLSASGPEGPTPDDWSALASAVPEPAGAAAMGLAMLAMCARRRRAAPPSDSRLG